MVVVVAPGERRTRPSRASWKCQQFLVGSAGRKEEEEKKAAARVTARAACAERRGWVETEPHACTGAGATAEQSEDGWAVQGSEAAEETAVGDDTAEGSAGG